MLTSLASAPCFTHFSGACFTCNSQRLSVNRSRGQSRILDDVMTFSHFCTQLDVMFVTDGHTEKDISIDG